MFSNGLKGGGSSKHNALLGSTLGRHLLPQLFTPGLLPYTKGGGRQDQVSPGSKAE